MRENQFRKNQSKEYQKIEPDWISSCFTKNELRENQAENFQNIESDYLGSGWTVKTDINLKPGSTLFMLTVMMITSIGITTVNAAGESIEELASKKMTRDPDLPNDIDDKQCQEIPKKIAETTKKLPSSEPHVRRVLEHKESKVICTSKEELSEGFSVHGLNNAFDYSKAAIYLSYNTLSMRSVNHEFLHADRFFMHQTKNCKSKNITDQSSPILLETLDDIRKYEAALNKMKSRVDDFRKLRIKESRKEKLNLIESKRLTKYKDASKDCLCPPSEDVRFPISQYEVMINRGWHPGKTDFLILNQEGLTVRVLKIERSSSGKEIHVEIEPFYPEDYILFAFNLYDSPNFEKAHRNRAKKQGLGERDQRVAYLKERDAHYFEHLSQNAINVFAPEAYELRQNDNKRCMERANSDEKKLDL